MNPHAYATIWESTTHPDDTFNINSETNSGKEEQNSFALDLQTDNFRASITVVILYH